MVPFSCLLRITLDRFSEESEISIHIYLRNWFLSSRLYSFLYWTASSMSLKTFVLCRAPGESAVLANGNMRPNKKEKENRPEGSSIIVWVHAPSTAQVNGLVVVNFSPRKAREPKPTAADRIRQWKHEWWLVLEVRPHCRQSRADLASPTSEWPLSFVMAWEARPWRGQQTPFTETLPW